MHTPLTGQSAQKVPPSTSHLLSSALPRPHHCLSHIWTGSSQGPQQGASVAMVGVSADSAPLALEAGNLGLNGAIGPGPHHVASTGSPVPSRVLQLIPPHHHPFLSIMGLLNPLLCCSSALVPRNLLPPMRVTLIIPLPLDRTGHVTCPSLLRSPISHPTSIPLASLDPNCKAMPLRCWV